MASRLELHSLLKTLMENVYYQSPVNTVMTYPAIRYSRTDVDMIYADNNPYHNTNGYEIIVIDKQPDNSVIDTLLNMPMCKFDRHYVSDGLNHDVFKLYW